MKTSIELVPRTREQLLQEMEDIAQMDIPYDGFNLPELRRKKGVFLSPEELMAMRTEGMLAPEKELTLHLRTSDLPIDATLLRLRDATRSSVTRALLITGDPIDGGERHGILAHELLPHLTEINDLAIGVGLDPYQPGFGRWPQKMDAIRRGVVNSIFTQPLFHPSQLDQVLDQTNDVIMPSHVFIGISWVTSTKGRDYWHRQNAVPLSLLPQGEANDTIRQNSIAQAINVLRAANTAKCSVYVMMMNGTLQELKHLLEARHSL